MSKKMLLFEHAQRYICEVMADRLRAEGFVSYKGEGVHWYRLVSNEVVQAVYFVARSTNLHSFFDIYYGCHPLFIPPVFQKSPYFYAMPCYEQMHNQIPEVVPESTLYGVQSLMLYGSCNRPYRIPDAMIICPADKNNGLDILEQVFPFLDSVNTSRACYDMHKQLRENGIKSGNVHDFSTYFVDEVLFWEDVDIYGLCRMYLDRRLHRIMYLKKTGERASKAEQAELERCLLLDQVFREENRLEYLKTLHERELHTLRMLKKNCNLQ